MKKLTLTLLITTLTMLITGCNPQTMVSYQLDERLPTLNNVKVVEDNTAIGFEWQPLYRKGIEGVNIYRSEPNIYANSNTKRLTKVATVNSPFASHYVDTGLKQNSTYTYTFTTIKGGYESAHGKIIDVKTLPPLPKVTFFQGVQKSPHAIKLIWRPHPNKKIKMYKIERSLNGAKWVWVSTIENRLMAEYIDIYVKPGNKYQYKIIAVGFDGSYSIPSDIVTIHAR